MNTVTCWLVVSLTRTATGDLLVSDVWLRGPTPPWHARSRGLLDAAVKQTQEADFGAALDKMYESMAAGWIIQSQMMAELVPRMKDPRDIAAILRHAEVMAPGYPTEYQVEARMAELRTLHRIAEEAAIKGIQAIGAGA